MSSSAFSGVGTTFGRATVQAGPFTAIAEINSISGPDKTRGTIDTTSLDSTGGYREFIPSFRDSGQIQLEMNFTRAGYELLNDDFEDETAKWYQIALPDTEDTKLTFSAFVSSISTAVPLDDKVTASVTLKITGQTYLTYMGPGGSTTLS